ncbi:hypothetical protein IWX50DRAFT_653983 [Phyllosticta citricarpa]
MDDELSSAADLPKEESQKQSAAHRLQPQVKDSQDWLDISYFEALHSLGVEQTSATTEDQVTLGTVAKTTSLRGSTEQSLQGESTVPEHSNGQEAAQTSEVVHTQDVDVQDLKQQDKLSQPDSDNEKYTSTSNQTGSLLANLFPEMTRELDAEDRALEQQDDDPENQKGLFAAVFPELASAMKDQEKKEKKEKKKKKKEAVEEDLDGLLKRLFPDLDAAQFSTDENVHQKQLVLETNHQNVKSGGQAKPNSRTALHKSLFPEEDCEQTGQLPKAVSQREFAMTSGQKSAQEAEGRVKTEGYPGLATYKEAAQGGTGTKQENDQDLSYHDVPPENLHEELFPKPPKKQDKNQVTRREFEVPKIRLDPAAGTNITHYISSEIKESSQPEKVCILNLQAVSPRLTEEDIRCLLPRSAHIEGWSSEYMKTIPIRDPTTLARKDEYCIIFRSVRGAINFKYRLINLHDTLLKHAPTSMLSPRTVPLSLTDSKTGEDLSAALKLYTLGPPSRPGNVYATVQREPWPHDMARLVHNGGYPQVTDLAPGVAAKVLLHFEGVQPTKSEIVDAIRADGFDRGVPWDVLGGVNGGPTVVAGVVQMSTARRGDAFADQSSLMRKLPPRWLISFRSKSEAHRFVRRWHRRPFPTQPKEVADYGEDLPTAEAEVLW